MNRSERWFNKMSKKGLEVAKLILIEADFENNKDYVNLANVAEKYNKKKYWMDINYHVGQMTKKSGTCNLSDEKLAALLAESVEELK